MILLERNWGPCIPSYHHHDSWDSVAHLTMIYKLFLQVQHPRDTSCLCFGWCVSCPDSHGKLDLKSEIYRAILELHTPQTVEVYDSLWILGWPYDQKSLPNLCRSCRRRHGAESIGNNPALIFDFGRWSIAIVNLWFIGDISIIL